MINVFIKPKSSLTILISIIVFAFIAIAVIATQANETIYEKILIWIPVLLFIWYWKELCLKARIEIINGNFNVIAPRVTRETLPVRLSITMDEYHIPIEQIAQVRLWNNKNPELLNKMGSKSVLNEFVGKGQLILSIETMGGEKARFDIGAFKYSQVRDFLQKYIPNKVTTK